MQINLAAFSEQMNCAPFYEKAMLEHASEDLLGRRNQPGETLLDCIDGGFGSCVTSAPSRVLAALNCTRDEGGPFEFGNQVLISSHRKLLRLRAVVVSVAETPGR